MGDNLLRWEKGRWSDRGMAGKYDLFSVSYGTVRSDKSWSLATSLPITGGRLGQQYETPDEAKESAEKILRAFIREIGGA